MSNIESSQAQPKSEADASAHINITPSGMAGLQLYHQEIATYLRELPRLLAEGHAGCHALVKDADIVGVWDDQAEAIKAGRTRFGLDPIYVKKIDPRDAKLYSLLKVHLGTACPF